MHMDGFILYHRLFIYSTKNIMQYSILSCVYKYTKIFKKTRYNIMKNNTFLYENKGPFGIFHFKKDAYPMLKTLKGMPSVDFDESVRHIIITPKSFDALCILGDFVDKNGFDVAIKDNTTTTLWSKIIAFLGFEV